ncbi:MAG: nucleolar RNA-binding Nop10p family protein [Candidatus Thorarchaeota archaeon]
MPKKLLKCPNCFNYAISYTGQSHLCKKCGTKLKRAHPGKFSMNANKKYLTYVRKLKKSIID